MTARREPVVLAAGLAAAGLLLQACATKPTVYGPITAEVPHGYADRPSNDGGFTVLVRMPGTASVAMLRDFFDRRAAELCTAGVDRTNVFRVTANEAYAPGTYVYGSVGMGSRARFGTEMEGYVYCKPGVTAPATVVPAPAPAAKAE